MKLNNHPQPDRQHMPDKKKPSELTPEASIPTPKRPPKQPRMDYTTLPQKPITLKHEVQSPAVLKQAAKKTKRRPHTRSNPTDTSKTVKKKTPHAVNQWDLNGISPEAREKALAAAAKAGINLDAWIERLILQGESSANIASDEKETAISESLKSIDERLDRLENQRGFWVRFWDRFMEQR